MIWIWVTYTQKIVRHIILITNFNMSLHTWWILCCWWRSSTIAKCVMTIEGACLFLTQKESYYISGYACIVLGLSVAIQTTILAYSFNSTSSFSLLWWWNILNSHPHQYELECAVSNLHDRRASCTFPHKNTFFSCLLHMFTIEKVIHISYCKRPSGYTLL